MIDLLLLPAVKLKSLLNFWRQDNLESYSGMILRHQRIHESCRTKIAHDRLHFISRFKHNQQHTKQSIILWKRHVNILIYYL